MPQPRKRLIIRGSCPHFRLGHTSDIHSHSYSNVRFSHRTANITDISCGDGFSFSFSFVLVFLVIIDPVQQGDALLSHPICQVSAVPVTAWCSGLAILCIVMYQKVCLFTLNHAGPTTVHIRLETSSVLPVDLNIWGFSSQCASRWFLNVFTVLLLTIS